MIDEGRMEELIISQKGKEPICLKEVIDGLQDKAVRSADQSAGRIMLKAVTVIKCLGQQVNELRGNLKELEEKQQWIPVTERLPKRGADIIVCSHRTIKPVVFTTYFWDEKHDNWLGITHWMPLPEPPKEVE